ncbi:hypothetical protein D9M72_488070 [compost metagenome]
MQLQAELAEPDLAQTPVDDVEGRDLLGDEEHTLALGQALRDEVRDGLAFAGAGRADENEVLAPRGGHDGRQLRRIRRQRAEGLLWAIVLVQQARIGKCCRAGIRIAWRIDEVLDYRVLTQLVSSLHKINPHQILGKGEGRQHNLFGHLPPLDVFDGH